MKWLYVAALAAGCGSGGGNSTPSDAASDGMSDSSTTIDVAQDASVSAQCDPTKPAGPVKVRRHFGGFVLVSHDSTGAYLGQVSSPSYTAQIDVPGCGAITLASTQSPERITVTAIEPGDEIDLGGTSEATMFQDVFIDQAVPGATQYQVVGGNGCVGFTNATTSPASFRYDNRCADTNGTFTLIAFANDVNAPSASRVLAYAVLDKVSLAAPLHITSWTAPAQHHLTVTLHPNVPAESATWSLHTIVNGAFYGAVAKTALGTASSFDIDLPHVEYGVLAWSNVTLMYPNQGRSYNQVIAAPVPAQLNAPLSTQLLPLVHSGQRDNDPERPTLSWIVDSTMVEEDFVAASVPVAPLNGPNNGDSWLIFTPPGTRSLRVPELPANLRVRFLAAPDRVFAKITDYADVPDYRSARQLPHETSYVNSVPTLGAVDRESWIEP